MKNTSIPGNIMLTVRHLNRHFQHRRVIQDLTFSLSPGERVGLFAPSGAGKTTLIRILAGVDTRYSGVAETKARQRCAVFQDPGLFWYKTVAENIRYPLNLRQLPFDAETEALYREWLTVTGLSEAEHLYPFQLSGGMKQKAALVRAFLLMPDLALLDEPFSWIDMASKQNIIKYIQYRHPETTLFIAAHGMDDMAGMAQTVMVFPEGPISRYRRVPVPPDAGFGALAASFFPEGISMKGDGSWFRKDSGQQSE